MQVEARQPITGDALGSAWLVKDGVPLRMACEPPGDRQATTNMRCAHLGAVSVPDAVSAPEWSRFAHREGVMKKLVRLKSLNLVLNDVWRCLLRELQFDSRELHLL